ncbi:hypothetical protein SOHN41_03799 [Shewanella sp. HN-41]|nr:hypothetical protein SOHN41_03799 [Shewanella sp. HN-41]
MIKQSLFVHRPFLKIKLHHYGAPIWCKLQLDFIKRFNLS